MNEKSDQTFFLLKSFQKILAHQIRTPLSVISNDLYYLQSITAQGECDRSVEKCKAISRLLLELDSWGTSVLEIQEFDLAILLSELFANVDSKQSVLVRADKARLHMAFKSLKRIVLELLGATTELVISVQTPSKIELLAKAASQPEWMPKSTYSAHSLTQLVYECAKRDFTECCFVDAIFLASGISTCIEAEGKDFQFTFLL